MTSPLLYCSVIQGLTFACDIKRALTLCQNLGGVKFFILVHVFTCGCGVFAMCTPHPFSANVVARITKVFTSGCHLRDREVMPSPRGIVGIYPLGP